MLSNEFITAVKLDSRRSYQIAHSANLHPSTLSQIINGISLVKPGDPRVLAVAKVLGLSPEECFDVQDEAA
jgi:hypothetical protein